MALPRPFLDLTVAEWLDELAGADASSRRRVGARLRGGGGGRRRRDGRARVEGLVGRRRWRGRAGAAAPRPRRAARAGRRRRVPPRARRATRGGGPAPDRRDFEIGRAFAAAAEPLLEIARTAADVAELAAELAVRGDGSVRPDAAAAAGARGRCGARGAVAFVAANLTAIEGDPRVAEVERAAAAAETAAARAARAARE